MQFRKGNLFDRMHSVRLAGGRLGILIVDEDSNAVDYQVRQAQLGVLAYAKRHNLPTLLIEFAHTEIMSWAVPGEPQTYYIEDRLRTTGTLYDACPAATDRLTKNEASPFSGVVTASHDGNLFELSFEEWLAGRQLRSLVVMGTSISTCVFATIQGGLLRQYKRWQYDPQGYEGSSDWKWKVGPANPLDPWAGCLDVGLSGRGYTIFSSLDVVHDNGRRCSINDWNHYNGNRLELYETADWP